MKVINFQLESTKIADDRYAREYEEASLAMAKAKANLRAVNAQNQIRIQSARANAEAAKIEAEGKKNATVIEAEGEAEARKIEARARNDAAEVPPPELLLFQGHLADLYLQSHILIPLAAVGLQYLSITAPRIKHTQAQAHTQAHRQSHRRTPAHTEYERPVR